MKKRIMGSVVTFTFEHGTPPYSFDTALASRECREYAVPFAFGHRLGDAAAGCKSETERRAAVAALGAYYIGPAGGPAPTDWDMRGLGVVKENPTIAAIAAAKGVTYAEAEAWLANDVLAGITRQTA